MITTKPSYRWVVLILCFLTLTCGYAYMSIWSMILPELMAEFNVTNATAQLGNSLLLAGYAVASYVLALLAAKIGRKKASSVGLLCFVVGTFGIPFCNSFALILVLRFLQGCGIVWGLNVGLASAWCSSKSRGFASGVVGSGLCVGSGFGGWYAAMLWKHFPNWRDCFLNGGYLFLAFIVLFLIFVKDAPANLYPEEAAAAETRVQTDSKPKRSVWKTAGAWLCTLALFCECWAATGLSAILPQYCYSLGYSMDQAGNALLISGLVGIVLTPIGGMLSDAFVKRGADPLKARAYCMAAVAFLPSVVVIFLCPVIAPISIGMVYLIALANGTCGPIGNASLGALPMDLMGDPVLADKMFGMTILCGLSGGVIVPYALSAVQNSAGWLAAWIVCGLGAVGGAVIGFIMPKFKTK